MPQLTWLRAYVYTQSSFSPHPMPQKRVASVHSCGMTTAAPPHAVTPHHSASLVAALKSVCIFFVYFCLCVMFITYFLKPCTAFSKMKKKGEMKYSFNVNVSSSYILLRRAECKTSMRSCRRHPAGQFQTLTRRLAEKIHSSSYSTCGICNIMYHINWSTRVTVPIYDSDFCHIGAIAETQVGHIHIYNKGTGPVACCPHLWWGACWRSKGWTPGTWEGFRNGPAKMFVHRVNRMN